MLNLSRLGTAWCQLFAFLILISGNLSASPSTPSSVPSSVQTSYVKMNGSRFEQAGNPYYFVGTNFWYGMNLGSLGPSGDRSRLLRELDRLKAAGVNNLRIIAGTEGPHTEPWRISPALQTAPGIYDPELLQGLDFLLAEMKKRHLLAVVCLNNFWPWSGGMAQYLRWAGARAIPYPPPQPGGTWGTFQNYAADFYSNRRAVAMSHDFIRMIVTRTNSYTGIKNSEDPAIMAWELANEPRGINNIAAYNHWIENTADLIKSLDKNHLVTTGSEGETPDPVASGVNFVTNHGYKSIDYATAHIWAQNWNWYQPERGEETFSRAVSKMKEYLTDHLEKAKKLGKPLVIEEFGLARDAGSFDPASPTHFRDRYFSEIFEQVYQFAKKGAPVSGINFWAWAGEAEPKPPHGGFWSLGDPFVGDPPHENQGWYSIYSRDHDTIQLISKYAAAMSSLR